MKPGDDHVITAHGFVDSRAVCEQIARAQSLPKTIFPKLSVTSRLELMRYAFNSASTGTFVPDRDR